MVQVVCDRCGAVIPADGKIGGIVLGSRDAMGAGLASGGITDDRHFCQGCMLDIKGYIESYPTGAGRDMPPQKGKTGKRRVDEGKVAALAEAGWNARKIADDMGISLQSVYKVLRCHDAADRQKEGLMEA